MTPEAAILARTHSLRAASHVAILKALETAGMRFARRAPRSRRTLLQSYPPMRLHTEVAVPIELYDILLAGAWTALAEVAPDCLVQAVDQYTRELLSSGVEHSINYLTPLLAEYGMCDQPREMSC